MRDEDVVLLQMGGPESLDGLEPFLANVFSDPEIIQLPRWLTPFQPRLARFVARRRAPRMRPKYAGMGGGSPLRRETEAQARALARELAERGRPARVHVAMRYAAPPASEAVAALAGRERVTLLPLYPHWTRATTGTSVSDFASAARAAGWRGRIELVRSFPTLPSYLRLLEEQIGEALKSVDSPSTPSVHLVMSAHGLPKSYVARGDPYAREVEATASRVGAAALRMGYASWRLGYQSKVGPVEWLRPYTDDVLREAKEAGASAIVAVPLGFVSDHVETLYDLDVLYRGQAEALGMRFHRVPAFNDDPRFAAVLADALESLPREEVAL